MHNLGVTETFLRRRYLNKTENSDAMREKIGMFDYIAEKNVKAFKVSLSRHRKGLGVGAC